MNKNKSKSKSKDKTNTLIEPIEYTIENPRRSIRIQELKIKMEKEQEANKQLKKLQEAKFLSRKRNKTQQKNKKVKQESPQKVAKIKEAKQSNNKKEKKVKKDKPFKAENKGYFLMNKNTKLGDDDCQEFLNGTCLNSYCKAIHNYSKLFKEKNNEEFARRYFSLHQDFQVLAPFERKLIGSTSLDLLFIVDCSGSMGSYINQVKIKINEIIDHIKESNPHSEINIGFVGYRDHYNGNDRLLHKDFTSNIDDIKKYIGTVQTISNNDSPEDVTGGLDLGLKMTWKSKAKFAILIGDEPCHGKQYHNTNYYSNDYHFNGCPNGFTIENLVEQYAKNSIVLTVMKLTNHTDRMFKIMAETYKKESGKDLLINDIKSNLDNFGVLISYAASTTLNSVTFNGISIKDFLNNIQKETVECETSDLKGNEKDKIKLFITRMNRLVEINEQKEEELPVDLKHNDSEPSQVNIFDLKENQLDLNYKIKSGKEPSSDKEWNSLSQFSFNSKCHSFTIPKDRHSYINWKNPFIKKSSISTEIQIADKPFSEGAMRYAFYMKDNKLDQKLVGKLYKVIKKEENNIDTLSKDLLSIVVSKHIAYDFNDRVINIVPNTNLLLNYVDSYIYELLDYSSSKDLTTAQLPNHQRYYSVENYLKGDYTKFNNNSGWTSDNMNEQSQVAQAFSHFSWQLTKGYLMIVDLQGVDNILTDPQIHCLDRTKFGKGNLGYVGIIRFFLTHVCNSYCKKLNLIHPRTYVDINKDYDFFVDKYIPPERNDLVNKVCDICKVPYKANAFDLYDKKKKCWDSFCNDCDKKRKESFKGAKCKDCGNFFKSSAFIYQMRREEFPKLCQKCNIDTRKTERQDFDENIKEVEEVEMN